MRKINSNSYAWRWILAGLAPLAMAGILAAARDILGLVVPKNLINALLLAGAVALLGFGLFLAVELTQDRRLYAHYQRNRCTKLPLRTGLYECQSCGFQQVRKDDRACRSCGVTFV